MVRRSLLIESDDKNIAFKAGGRILVDGGYPIVGTM
jgi:hypothetical protein